MIITGDETTWELTDEQVQRLAGNVLQSMEELNGATADFEPTTYQRQYLRRQVELALDFLATIEQNLG